MTEALVRVSIARTIWTLRKGLKRGDQWVAGYIRGWASALLMDDLPNYHRTDKQVTRIISNNGRTRCLTIESR